MIKNWKAVLATLVFCASSFGAGAVFTASAQARSEWGSGRNLVAVRHDLEGLIDQLQRDNRDYGGHRIAAVNELQEARGQLTDALQYDRSHPGQ